MAERLLAALEGGQSKGGDSRGMQSGGLIVVQPVADLSASLQADRVVDIRVDDAENPFKELRRILNVRMSGNHTTRHTAGERWKAVASDCGAEDRIGDESEERADQLQPGGVLRAGGRQQECAGGADGCVEEATEVEDGCGGGAGIREVEGKCGVQEAHRREIGCRFCGIRNRTPGEKTGTIKMKTRWRK